MELAMSTTTHHVSDSEILAAMEDVDEPMTTATEISERVGLTRQAVNHRLQKLNDQGAVGRKKIGSRAVAWWIKSD